MRRSEIFITCTEEVKERLLEMFEEYCPFYYGISNCDGVRCDECLENVNIHWKTDDEYEN